MRHFNILPELIRFDCRNPVKSFINKHTIDLENVQRNKKKEKGEVTGLIGLGNVMFLVCINEQVTCGNVAHLIFRI
jgi:hypothetical protein